MRKMPLLGQSARKPSVLPKQRQPAAHLLHPVLHLQHTLGNQAVSRLVQAKLKIGQPGDRYEQEADRVADTVMRQPVGGATILERRRDPVIMRACPSCEEELPRRQRQGKPCPECEANLPADERRRLREERQQIRQEQQERRRALQQQREEEPLQRKELPGQGHEQTPNLDDQLNVTLNSGGQVIPAATRTFMEANLGHEFSEVRVHTDAQAAEAARQVRARAFTLGKNVVFGAGEYTPETVQGRRLLAHELTHVVQQGQSRQLSPASHPNPAAKLQQTPSGPSLQRVGVGENIARFFGGGTFSEEELQTYLAFLKARRHIEDSFDSDNKAREIVKRWKRGDSKYAILPVEIKILLIQEMLAEFTGDDDERAILDLLRGSTDPDLATILRRIGVETLNENFHLAEQDELDELLAKRKTGIGRSSQQERDRTKPTSRGVFSEQKAQEAQERFMENALLGEARAHCIKIIHDVLPGLFAHDARLQERVSRRLRQLRQRGETYTIDATGEALRELGLASGGAEIYFTGNKSNGRIEPGALESSAWDTIMGMVGNEVGWHIFGMSLFNGYHSVAVFVNHRPDGKKLVYWADQWAIGPGEDFHQEAGSASGFRRYERTGFDRFITEFTHSRWCTKSTCDAAHWRARLTIWKFYTRPTR